MEKDSYQKEFYDYLRTYSIQSAEVIVPIVLDLIQCSRVVDVGCGDGTWLKVFHDRGVKEILGIDGDYVNEDILAIPKENFIPLDLKQPIEIGKQFDLVVSLEVAEHLPSEVAETFVNSLTSLGSVILFSAAIPNQGGVNHINEQWQDYWVNLFQSKNYVLIDCMRKQIWNNEKVAHWYRQNILLFVNQDELSNHSNLQDKYKENSDTSLLRIVHPVLFSETKMALLKAQEDLENTQNPEKVSLRRLLSLLPGVVKHTLIRKTKSYFFKSENSI
jgi:SAM-dependent methyltransferase